MVATLTTRLRRSGRGMHWLLGPSDTRNVASMLPRTVLEIFIWILVSVSAGICEEFVYRGYLQRQFAAMTRSVSAALVLQSSLGFRTGIKAGNRS
jgi:membrane protease YdiL (CAAX protease family)